MRRPSIILIMLMVVSLPLVSYGKTLSAFGTATIDGKMSLGEWDNAAKIDFLVNIPSSNGATVPATFYIMNDETNIYFALKFPQSSFGKLTQFDVDFDNNNNGIANDGEDDIAIQASTFMPSPLFYDFYRYTCPLGSAGCFTEDKDENGNILKNGNAFAVNGASMTTIEMWHPLKSGDSLHDISLDPGSTVGLRATLKLLENAPSPRPGPTGVDAPPPASTDTVLPATGYEHIMITSQVIQAVIDIKPGSKVNSINSGSEGKIPVAIMSDPDFKAPARVDRSSLTFGRTGDEKSLAFCNAGSEDVNGDGITDLVCHFSTKVTAFQPGDDSGILKGLTTDGTIFTGEDSVRIVR